MISYEVVEKIMKFSRENFFFFHRVIKKPDFQPQIFRVFFGQKRLFHKNSRKIEISPSYWRDFWYVRVLIIRNTFLMIFGRNSAESSKFASTKLKKIFFQGPKMAKNRFSQKWPRSVVDAQNWSQIIF